MGTKMINIKIDGKEIQAMEGQLLTDVARENGFYIPTLCYFKEIFPPLATCRICTVKVNGRMETGCTTKVYDGMEIKIDCEEVIDTRKAVVEMLFAEGNHYCPACSKSGNCSLQRRGYEMGVAISRFPHLFEEREKDFKPSKIFFEHNRCILCKRCVEQVKTNDGENIFFFQKRGHKIHVGIDYEKEMELTEEEAMKAMDLCPVGAILVKGVNSIKPMGDRKFDAIGSVKYVPQDEIKVKIPDDGEKKVVATTSLAGCFGCHMSILDIDTELLDVLELVEFNKSPITDIKKFSKRCDVGIIEGGVANSENFEVLKEFRKKCDILIALGECSIWGGMPAMRNTLPIEECLQEAYVDGMTVTTDGKRIIPYHEDIPKLLDKVYATNDIVKIDYFIPGCPPSADHIWKVVKNVLFDANIPISYEEYKYD